MTHYDLFAGIGGFSLAIDEVFSDETVRHIFCEWESFPTAVLKKHWPDGEFWGDIKELVTHTERQRWSRGRTDTERQHGQPNRAWQDQTILTGGFPCQPFSHAGRRKGTADDRYQWPNMFRVIQNVKPDWVVAENVRGLVTWNDGMVLEQICSDLESEGYEVQPIIIPAVAVNAPHRRDRVWIIAHSLNDRSGREEPEVVGSSNSIPQINRPKYSATRQPQRADSDGQALQPHANARPQRRDTGISESLRPEGQEPERQNRQHPDWSRNWQEVAFATCNDSMDDGLSRLVDGVPYSQAKWRRDSLKAYGNGIVPQVAIEIMRAIKQGVLSKEADNEQL